MGGRRGGGQSCHRDRLAGGVDIHLVSLGGVPLILDRPSLPSHSKLFMLFIAMHV